MEPPVIVSGGGGARGGVPLWQWGLLGLGVVLLLASGYGYLGGKEVYHGSVEPDVSAGGTQYSALGLDLTPGTYTLRLRVSHSGCGTLLGSASHRFTVQIPELPTWQTRGSLSHGTTQKKQLGSDTKRTVTRPEATDSVVMKLPRGGKLSLRMGFEEPLRDRLEVRMRRVPFDPRVPLFAGVVVLILAIALGDRLREVTLGAIVRR